MRGAADLYLHEVATTQTRELSTWLGARQEWSEEWNRSADMSSMTLRLTPELTRELAIKIHELVDTYRDLPVTEDNPEAKTVRMQTRTFPMNTD